MPLVMIAGKAKVCIIFFSCYFPFIIFTAVLNFSHVVALAVDGRGKAVQSVVAELISALGSRRAVLPPYAAYVAVVT